MPSAWTRCSAISPRGGRRRLGAAVAGRHRQRPGASSAGLHRRARPVRPVQFGDRAPRARAANALMARRQGGEVLLRRPQGLRPACAGCYETADRRAVELRAVRALGFEHAEGIADKILRALTSRVQFDVARCSSRASGRSSRRSRRRSRSSRPMFERGARRRRAARYEYEPDEAEILAELLPRNIAMQIFRALLENAGLVLRRADVGDGQRHAQRRRNDPQADADLQPHPPGDDHQRADRDHLRRGSGMKAEELLISVQ